MKNYVIGIDVGGTTIRWACSMRTEGPCEKYFLTDKEIGAEELMDLLAQQVRKLVASAGLTLTTSGAWARPSRRLSTMKRACAWRPATSCR